MVVVEQLFKVSSRYYRPESQPHRDVKVPATHFVKVLPTPLSGVLSCMAVKDSEVALSSYIGKICDERVGIFHCPSLTLVFRHADAIRKRYRWVLVEGLGSSSV